MKLGTKSLLFGCHQFILHPIFVLVAWRKIYPHRPWYFILHLYYILAAVVHDWGYWGCPNMDGPAGEMHPSFGAAIMSRVTGDFRWYQEVLLHSRSYAKRMGYAPSNMCWADKLGIALMPSWLWATLAWLSGEGWEYLDNPKYSQYTPNEPHTWRRLQYRHKRLSKEIIDGMAGYGLEVE